MRWFSWRCAIAAILLASPRRLIAVIARRIARRNRQSEYRRYSEQLKYSHVLIVVAIITLVACGKKPPVAAPTTVRELVIQEIKVPTPVIVLPPAELLAPFRMPLPIFVSPSDPNASSALTVEEERAMRAWVEERASRWEAIIAWLQSLQTK